MKRLLPLIALVLAAAVACQPVDPYAAIVNGQVIPASVLREEVKAVQSSPTYAEQINSQLSSIGGLQPGGPNTVNSSYTSQILFVRVLSTLLSQDLKQRGLTVSEQALAQTEQTIRSQNDPSVFDSLSPAYRDYIVRTQAELDTVLAARNTPEEQQRYYTENSKDFLQSCFRQMAVPNEAIAEQVRARVAAGEDFAAISQQVQAATSPGQPADPEASAPQCANASELSTTANNILDALQPNQVSAPISNGGEFVIVQLVSRTQKTFEQAQAEIAAKLTDSNELVTDLLKDADIQVNPKYGTYQKPNAAEGQTGGIMPSETKSTLVDGRKGAAGQDDLSGLGLSPETAPDAAAAGGAESGH